jgi:hypothetical protein
MLDHQVFRVVDKFSNQVLESSLVLHELRLNWEGFIPQAPTRLALHLFTFYRVKWPGFRCSYSGFLEESRRNLRRQVAVPAWRPGWL